MVLQSIKMLRYAIVIATTAALVDLATATSYTLVDSYTEANFFNEFYFWDAADPTNGFVNYLSARPANDDQLAGFFQKGIFLGTDHLNVILDADSTGRPSTRLQSRKTYETGLFIADVKHMPTGCGTWPALWTYGMGTGIEGDKTGWPYSGEIDIIEGVNTDNTTHITLHTSAGCVVDLTGSSPDTDIEGKNCSEASGNTNVVGAVGCSTVTNNTESFGAGFNEIGGGVYAMEWTTESISVWFFPRHSIPSGVIDTDTPNLEQFGVPITRFSSAGGCDFKQHFRNHTIVINHTMCGDWAGADDVWDQTPECKALAPDCKTYVAKNPEAFAEAYWLFDSIKVYQQTLGNTTRRSVSFRT